MDPFIESAIRYGFKRKIQHLTLFVTSKCNLRCRICFVDFDKIVSEKDLTLDEIQGIRNVLGRIPILNIGGGEPFLRKDLDEIVGIFSDALTIGIPTNGWYTDKVIVGLEKIFKHVRLNQVGLMISIDGFEQTHDYIRVKESFQRSIATLEAVRKNFPDLLIQVNTVLCRYNFEEIHELIRYLKQFKPSLHSVFFLRGNPHDEKCQLPDLKKLKAVIPTILGQLNEYNYGRKWPLTLIARNYHKYMFDLSLRILEKEEQLIPCHAGRAALVIHANGDVAPCELRPSVDNLREHDLSDIIKCEAYQNALADIKNRKCYCTHNCNMTENILFNPKNYLRLVGLNVGGY